MCFLFATNPICNCTDKVCNVFCMNLKFLFEEQCSSEQQVLCTDHTIFFSMCMVYRKPLTKHCDFLSPFFYAKKKTVLLLHWHNEGPEIKTSKLCFQKSPIYGYSGCKKIFAILGIFPQGLDLKRWHIA